MNEEQEPFEFAPRQWATPLQEVLLGMIRGFVPGLWLGLVIVAVVALIQFGWPDTGYLR